MTAVYITIDTELSAGLMERDGMPGRERNFAASITGRCADGEAGIFYQMDRFDRHGLKAVFFVDPMPALVWGTGVIEDIVGPVLERGHDVQLHIHTEWLALAGAANPLGTTIGRNIKDFSLADQVTLLGTAADLLQQAGAPRPVAFRAGNYGANDDTLRALAQLGIGYDTSHCPALVGQGECDISLGAEVRQPVAHCGVTEIPVGSIGAPNDRQRHAQLTALSSRELMAAVRHARDEGYPGFTIVSHSFELLSRDRTRINRIVKNRFETFCAQLAACDGVTTGTYRDNPPRLHVAGGPRKVLAHSFHRTAGRMLEQAIGNALYGSR